MKIAQHFVEVSAICRPIRYPEIDNGHFMEFSNEREHLQTGRPTLDGLIMSIRNEMASSVSNYTESAVPVQLSALICSDH
ncbi:hypothetical protein CEXT_153171 [Caerostris extrusa]|uniref:Uncharacterized protein n=1 Tax=Caerostris extrusa TaxID=172846 RepID=A0AAV4NUQ4_CAEEX|nr:hypothetical protein CEXT_153171 [Caerostris extrusa]